MNFIDWIACNLKHGEHIEIFKDIDTQNYIVDIRSYNNNPLLMIRYEINPKYFDDDVVIQGVSRNLKIIRNQIEVNSNKDTPNPESR